MDFYRRKALVDLLCMKKDSDGSLGCYNTFSSLQNAGKPSPANPWVWLK
jgi:hypothetical protein